MDKYEAITFQTQIGRASCKPIIKKKIGKIFICKKTMKNQENRTGLLELSLVRVSEVSPM